MSEKYLYQPNGCLLHRAGICRIAVLTITLRRLSAAGCASVCLPAWCFMHRIIGGPIILGIEGGTFVLDTLLLGLEAVNFSQQ